jgi:hypothetical protein
VRSALAMALYALGTGAVAEIRAALPKARVHGHVPGHVQPDSARCAAAARFLRAEPRTVAVVERDTIDDWRTGRRLPGCRVTAAGITRLGVAAEAARFFERLRAAAWTRTPDPRDSPNEASLRFRQGGTDCVFSVSGEPRLGTEAEFAVNDSVTARPGEWRYQVLVLCMPAVPAVPALPARPRDPPDTARRP